MENNENLECCGSECTNCVLDRQIKLIKSTDGCENVMKNSYTKFKLRNIEKCTNTNNIYELTFTWHNVSLVEGLNRKLMISGGSYLMMRAPKTVTAVKNQIFEGFYKNLVENQNFQRKIVQKHDTSEEDLYISRPYTPVSVDADQLQFTILIKLEPFGQMSSHIMSLQINDLTEWKGVFNNIPPNIRTSNYTNIVCFCHGVSIAPIYTISKELTEDEAFESNIYVNACFTDIRSILLRDKLIQLNLYWNFKSTIVLSRERHNEGCDATQAGCSCVKTSQKFSERLYYGRIDTKFIHTCVKTLQGRILVLLCGSETFTNGIKHVFDEILNQDIEIHIL